MNSTAAIDLAVVEPVLGSLSKKGWILTQVPNTFLHSGQNVCNLELKERTGCTIFGFSDAGLVETFTNNGQSENVFG